MKKIVLVIILIFSSYITYSQVIANFEDGKTGPLTLNVMGCGDWDNGALHPLSETFLVVDNPKCNGLNISRKVLKFNRRGSDQGGKPWGGFWANASPDITLSANKYLHVKVLKTRITPLRFKIEGAAGSLEQKNMYAQTKINEWEDIVFKFDTLGLTGSFPVVAFMPDYEDPELQTGLIEIYIDDIILSSDPNPIKTNTICDFENGTTVPFTLHVMGCGAWDDETLHPVSETFSVIPNPLKTGINQSEKVLKFNRRGVQEGGMPWGGFWANANPNLNLTENKYVHVKVLKTRISPLRCKIEGGASGSLEQKNMYAQTKVIEWEDIVFKFDALNITGLYPIFSFMPDYEDPQLTADFTVIYIDDIIINSDSVPITIASVTFNVNMYAWKTMGKFNPKTDFVDIAGNFNKWDGTNFHLTTSNDSIYSITVPNLSVGSIIEFKFRINGSWSDQTCEFPGGRSNRKYQISSSSNTYTALYNDQLLGIKENSSSGKIFFYPNPVRDLLNIKSSILLKEIVLVNQSSQQVLKYSNLTGSDFAMDFSGITNGLYFIIFKDRDGRESLQKLIKN
ncbi:MAG: T9SS type A sorting domain-containing protein [Bacteroidota bacterium]